MLPKWLRLLPGDPSETRATTKDLAPSTNYLSGISSKESAYNDGDDDDDDVGDDDDGDNDDDVGDDVDGDNDDA